MPKGKKKLMIPFNATEKAITAIEKIEKGALFKNLNDDEKISVIKYYRDQGKYTNIEIAKKLGISENLVIYYNKKIREARSEYLQKTGTEELAADVFDKYLAAYRLAMKKEKPHAAGDILYKMVKTLQDMGVIYKAPTKKQIMAAVKQQVWHSSNSEDVKAFSHMKSVMKGKELEYEQVVQELIQAVSSIDTQSEDESEKNNAQSIDISADVSYISSQDENKNKEGGSHETRDGE